MTKRKLSHKDRQEMAEWFSKYLADVSKLIFAGVVIGAIMSQDYDAWWLIVGGTLTALIVFLLAYQQYVNSKK